MIKLHRRATPAHLQYSPRRFHRRHQYPSIWPVIRDVIYERPQTQGESLTVLYAWSSCLSAISTRLYRLLAGQPFRQRYEMCRWSWYRWRVKNDSVSEHNFLQPFHWQPIWGAVRLGPERLRFLPATVEDPGFVAACTPAVGVVEGVTTALHHP